MLKQVQQTGISITPETLADYDLAGYDCSECNNTGAITRNVDGQLFTRECKCMAIRRSLRRIRNSGMTDMLSRYTLENYKTPDKEREKIKRLAERFLESESDWLYISGRSGSGKTHICTAICSKMIEAGIEVYYMSWRDESVNLKSSITDTELYEQKMKKLKTVRTLYIDDFFKGNPTDADVRLAYEIINARYNDTALWTIISSELDIKEILSIDEALGGRIYERAKNFVIQAPSENWRLR